MPVILRSNLDFAQKVVMYRAIGAVGLALYMAVTFPQKFMAEQAAEDSAEPRLAKVERTSAGTGKAVGYRDTSGHFSFNAMLNGTHVKVLVDTGASSVAINRTTARRIGIRVEDKDFRHFARTANGKARYAMARIDEVRIDGVTVRGVDALVLADQSLDGTLLGMSFLNRLEGYRFEGNKLTLVE